MSITYNYKKGSEKNFPDDVISARFRIYKDKDASGKEEVWTRTVKRPPEITARTKLVKYFQEEEGKFETECKDGLVPIKPAAEPAFVDYAAEVIEKKHVVLRNKRNCPNSKSPPLGKLHNGNRFLMRRLREGVFQRCSTIAHTLRRDVLRPVDVSQRHIVEIVKNGNINIIRTANGNVL